MGRFIEVVPSKAVGTREGKEAKLRFRDNGTVYLSASFVRMVGKSRAKVFYDDEGKRLGFAPTEKDEAGTIPVRKGDGTPAGVISMQRILKTVGAQVKPGTIKAVHKTGVPSVPWAIDLN